MTPTSSPATATASGQADFSPAPDDLHGPVGQVVAALGAIVVPLLIALYAILTTGKALEGRWKMALVAGAVGVYSVALVAMGLRMWRTPARQAVARTLIVSAGVLAALLAAAGWFISGQAALPLVLVNAAAASGLAALAAGAHARVSGRPLWDALPLVAAVLVLGLTGGRNVVVPRDTMMVLDAAATVLACGVFLRPGRGLEPPGRLALALAVPGAALLLRPLWYTTSLPELGGFVVGLLWALRALRARLHHGSVSLLALGLLTGALGPAVASVASRQLLLAVALAALLALENDLQRDPDAGPADQRVVGWLAGAGWLLLAGTWAHDLRLLERWPGLPRGFSLQSLPWLGLTALPLVVPPLVLAYLQRRLAPPRPDPDQTGPGATAEFIGWLVLVGAGALALAPAAWAPVPRVSLAVLAAIAMLAMVWARLCASAARQVAALLFLAGAVWVFSVSDGSPRMALAPVVLALAMALAPLARSRRRSGRTTALTGLVLFPVLAIDALARHGSVETGPLHLPGGLGRHTLTSIGALAAAAAIPAFLLARRRRQQAVAALLGAPDDQTPAVALEPVDPALVPETVGGALLAAAATLALAPAVTWSSLTLLAATTAVAAVWARVSGTPAARTAVCVLLLATVWLVGHWHPAPLASLATGACALSLALTPWLRPGAAREPGWTGFFLFPMALTEALVFRQAPVLAGAALLALFGLVHLVRTPLPGQWTRAVAVPALLTAAYLALSTPGAPGPVAALGVPAVLSLALLALALGVAAAGGPLLVGLQVLLGGLVLLLLYRTPLALVPMAVLAVGRPGVHPGVFLPGAFLPVAGSLALVLGGGALAALAPSGLALNAAAAALALGGLLLLRLRPLVPEDPDVRPGGTFALALAPLVLLFAPRPGGAWLVFGHAPLVAAATVAVGTAWVLVWGRPRFLVLQTVLGGTAVALAAIAAAFLQPRGSVGATLAGVGALIGLAAVGAAGARLVPESPALTWGIAALVAPLAVVPMTSDLWQWPIGLLGTAEVIVLAVAARRRASLVLAGCALGLVLLVSIWAAISATVRVLPDADLGLYAAGPLALAAALSGGLALLGGSRWLGLPALFVRPFVESYLWLAAFAAGVTAVGASLTSGLHIALAVAALAGVAALAVALHSWQRNTWPLLLAAGCPVGGYLFLRLRTEWLEGLQGWDALVAVAAAVLITASERLVRGPAAFADGAEWAAPQGPADFPADFPQELPVTVQVARLVAGVLAALSAVSLFQRSGQIWPVAPLSAALLFLLRARTGGPINAAVALVLFNATAVLFLLDHGVALLGTQALPIGASLAVLMHFYRERLGFDDTVRALPPLVVGGLCTFDALESGGLGATAALGGVGLALLPLSRLWRQRSHLWIGLLCLAIAGVAVATGRDGWEAAARALQDVSAVTVYRLIPLIALLASAAAAGLLWQGPRLLTVPPETVRTLVRDILAVAALATAATMALGPGGTAIDRGLALLCLAVVTGLALWLALRDRSGWPLSLVVGAPALAYVYLRVRTGWLDGLQGWDPLVAVAGGFLLAALERPLWAADPVAVSEPAPPQAPQDDLPFGVREVRIVSSLMTCLAALAFIDLLDQVDRRPLAALAPLLAALFFVLRLRAGGPVAGLLAAVFLNTTLVLLLFHRQVASAAAYALPVAVSLTVLVQVYRLHLGQDEVILRMLPPLAAAGACVYDVVTSRAVLGATAALVAIGLVLLLLSRSWRVRAYLPAGLACVGAALLTTITDWNARGWTAWAVAVGAATLLVPALLLRRR